MAKSMPTLEEEKLLHAAGYRYVAGVDEAGRGAWAGPLVAAACILPPLTEANTAEWERLAAAFAGVTDSKQLSHLQRERYYDLIIGEAQTGLGVVSSLAVDLIGVGAANQLAWKLAIKNLPVKPDYLLLDAFKLKSSNLPQKAIIGGDGISLSIAAASIVAKVTRDHLMCELDEIHPAYGLALHKGYGTAAHSARLLEHGPSPVHRYSYTPVWAAFQREDTKTQRR